MNFPITVLKSVISTQPKPDERYLGHRGVLTCNYTEPNAGYISVEWRYNPTGYDFTTAKRLYVYRSSGISGTGYGHLTNRSNHTHKAEQIKLFIFDLQDTDGGNYFCQILGSKTLRDIVRFQPISEYDKKSL